MQEVVVRCEARPISERVKTIPQEKYAESNPQKEKNKRDYGAR